MDDLVRRKDVINALHGLAHRFEDPEDWCILEGEAEFVVSKLPSVQTDTSADIQIILDYLDTVLHPLVSLDHWEVYSTLHDMVSALQLAQTVDKDMNVPCTDAIDRQAAIDAVSKACQEWRGIFGRCEDALKALPSAQLEIVRCKDCKHYKTEFCAIDLWTDEVKIYKARPDDFCSRAERREE